MPGRAESPPGRDVAVVVPAYDVAATIRDVVVRIRRAVPDANMYVVDDGSTDGTGAAAREQGVGVVVLVHRRNHGKGAALRTGIERALADGGRVIVTIYEVPGSGRGRGGSHFRWWADTWRQARVFTRYGRQIIFGAR